MGAKNKYSGKQTGSGYTYFASAAEKQLDSLFPGHIAVGTNATYVCPACSRLRSRFGIRADNC